MVFKIKLAPSYNSGIKKIVSIYMYAYVLVNSFLLGSFLLKNLLSERFTFKTQEKLWCYVLLLTMLSNFDKMAEIIAINIPLLNTELSIEYQLLYCLGIVSFSLAKYGPIKIYSD